MSLCMYFFLVYSIMHTYSHPQTARCHVYIPSATHTHTHTHTHTSPHIHTHPMHRSGILSSSGIQHGLTDSAVAVSPRAPHRQREPVLHQVDHQTWLGIQDHRSSRSCQEVGGEEEQTNDELREAQPRSEVLLRQEHHQESAESALRVPLCLWSRVSLRSVLHRAPEGIKHRRGAWRRYHYREEIECTENKACWIIKRGSWH